jgi:hypothetical protein
MNWLKGLGTVLVRGRITGETGKFGVLRCQRIGGGRMFADTDALDGLSRFVGRHSWMILLIDNQAHEPSLN